MFTTFADANKEVMNQTASWCFISLVSFKFQNFIEPKHKIRTKEQEGY